MTEPKWTRKIVSNEGPGEVVILDSTGNATSLDPTKAVDGYVHALDITGRPMYDERGRRVLIPWRKQKTPTNWVAIGIWVLVVIQIVGVIAGIVGAAALRDMLPTY